MASRGKSQPRPKVLVVLPDGFDYRLTQRYLESMPNARRMMAEGFSAQVLPFVSTWGNINFMSLLTATAPGTHYRRGTAPASADGVPGCAAETIWQALARDGRRSALVDLGQSWPPGADRVAVVASPDRDAPGPAHLFPACVHQTADLRTGLHQEGTFEHAGWPPGGGPHPNRTVKVLATPHASGAGLQTALQLAPGVEWPVHIHVTGGDRPARVRVRPGADGEAVELSVGRWTPWLKGSTDRPFTTRLCLLEISPDGRSLAILAGSGCPADTIAQPADLGRRLLEELGPYDHHAPVPPIPPRPDDPDLAICMEAMLDAGLWAVDAGRIALCDWDADLFLHKNYIVDAANHQCAQQIDPAFWKYDAERARRNDAVLRQAHANFDRMIGRLLAVAEELGNTHIVICGDHGICVNNWICDVNRRLADCGLLTFDGDDHIAPERSRAFTRRERQGNEIFVSRCANGGPVKVDEESEVCRDVVDALLDWKTPQGERVVAFALSKRDAAALGYWGPECGDLLFAYRQGFSWGVNPDRSALARAQGLSTNHGAGIPTQDTGMTSNMGMLLAWGPRIRHGVRRDVDRWGPIPIHHVGASLCALLECSPPRQASGAIIEDLFA